jgi:RNA polymerase sigma factor (sigma-70 family)
MTEHDDQRLAFERVFESHYWAVRAYVLRRAPASAVDDVVADTFLVAWRRLDSLTDDPLPWLFGVARRALANQHRSARRRGALAARLQTLVPTRAAGWEPPSQMSDALATAMAALPERQREALLLVAWEGLEPARAAVAAGCTPAAFRVRLHRARQQVAAELRPAETINHAPIPKETR